MSLRPAAVRLAALTALAALASPAPAAIVYSNDFEANTAGFDTASTTTLQTTADPAGPTSTYLGRFSNDSAVLSLTGLTVGAQYTVAFDLFIGASWDGNNVGVGPDEWLLTVGGATPETLVNTTFQNLNASEQAQGQNYSDTNPIGAGSFAAQTGADVAYFSAPSFFDRYAIYYFSHGAGNPVLTFTATGANVTLTFAGNNLQDVGDEFWALDNVVVTGPAANAVPAPGGLGLLAVGGLGLQAGRLRRRLA